MQKLAIIPARYASIRFPGKPLINLAGKSMIQRVYEGVVNTHLFDEVVVATDDERILNHVNDIGGNACMTSGIHNNGTERCGEVIKAYSNAEIVVNIQGDEPLVEKEQLATLLMAFNDDSTQIATLGTHKIPQEDIHNSNRIKIVVNHKNEALYFSRSAIPFQRNKLDYPFLRHIGLYAFRREVLEKVIALPETVLEKSEGLEQLRWLYHGFKIKVMNTEIETPNIDVPEDVKLVLAILNEKNSQ